LKSGGNISKLMKVTIFIFDQNQYQPMWIRHTKYQVPPLCPTLEIIWLTFCIEQGAEASKFRVWCANLRINIFAKFQLIISWRAKECCAVALGNTKELTLVYLQKMCMVKCRLWWKTASYSGCFNWKGIEERHVTFTVFFNVQLYVL